MAKRKPVRRVELDYPGDAPIPFEVASKVRVAKVRAAARAQAAKVRAAWDAIPMRRDEAWNVTRLETTLEGFISITKRDCDGEAFGFDFTIREGVPYDPGRMLLSFEVVRSGRIPSVSCRR